MLHKAAGVDQPLVSLFPALSSPSTVLQAQPTTEDFSLPRPELWCWEQINVCACGVHPLDECCEPGDAVKPGAVSLRHGSLAGCGLPSSNSMTGLVGPCAQQTHLRKGLCTFAWIHLPILAPASGHMRRTMSSGLEMLSKEEKETNA